MSIGSFVLAFGFPGMPEMLIVLFLALLLFGGAKLPGLMRNLGRAGNEFKKGMNEALDEEDDANSTENS